MKEVKNKFDWGVIGNEHILGVLEKSIKNEKLASAYIFFGPDNLGKTKLALRLSQILLCQGGGDKRPCGKCPYCQKFLIKTESAEGATEADFGEVYSDFYLVKKEKDKKNISIEQIREFTRKLSMSSFLNSYKIGIIKHAHCLSEEAANALLKTLEEPKEKVIIILITSDIDEMPLTIMSRCQVLRFHPISREKIYDYLISERKSPRSLAKNLSSLCLGRPALAAKFFENSDFYDAYLRRAGIFLNFFSQDINARFRLVEELLGEEASGQEGVNLASRIIEAWSGLTRDLLMLEFNQEGLIQYESLKEEMSGAKTSAKLANLLRIADILKQADEYLKANVNPKLVLEQVALNI